MTWRQRRLRQDEVRRLGRHLINLAFGRRRAQASRDEPYPDVIQPGRFESTNLPSTTNHNWELCRVRASRWIELFPDELVIQEKTISIIRRSLLMSFVETLPVKDIGRVVLVDTPLFDGLRVLGKNAAHDLSIRGLAKRDARYARQVIERLLLESDTEESNKEMHWVETNEPSELTAGVGRHGGQVKK